jgi:hypothetical protein
VVSGTGRAGRSRRYAARRADLNPGRSECRANLRGRGQGRGDEGRGMRRGSCGRARAVVSPGSGRRSRGALAGTETGGSVDRRDELGVLLPIGVPARRVSVEPPHPASPGAPPRERLAGARPLRARQERRFASCERPHFPFSLGGDAPQGQRGFVGAGQFLYTSV